MNIHNNRWTHAEGIYFLVFQNNNKKKQSFFKADKSPGRFSDKKVELQSQRVDIFGGQANWNDSIYI